MVARIRSGKSITRAFFYNENKVKQGSATLLTAVNYPLLHNEMSETQRLNMLLRRCEGASTIRSNAIHISLNFAKGELLEQDVLKAIAQEYMDAIGFGNQPYLLYEHNDAGHPHIHIVTVKIDENGHPIDTNFIGKLKSEPARKAIEKKYGLVIAEEKKELKQDDEQAQKLLYGGVPTKRQIENILKHVLPKYKYTSLHELNAVLSLYNIRASRGSESSRVYRNGGLVYQPISPDGEPIGVGIKASLFATDAKLKDIETRFFRNDLDRQKQRKSVVGKLDLVLKSNTISNKNHFADLLKKNGIQVVFRENKDGRIYWMTYVDMLTKTVWNGSTLGKVYSANAVSALFKKEKESQRIDQKTDNRQFIKSEAKPDNMVVNKDQNVPATPIDAGSTLEQLLKVEQSNDYVVWAFSGKKKKKKRKRTD